MDIKEIIEQIKESVKKIEKKDTEKEKASHGLVSSIAHLMAENIVLKSADDTARSLVMSLVMENGGSIILNNRVDHKTCGYELTVEPSEGDSLILKAVKIDVSMN